MKAFVFQDELGNILLETTAETKEKCKVNYISRHGFIQYDVAMEKGARIRRIEINENPD